MAGDTSNRMLSQTAARLMVIVFTDLVGSTGMKETIGIARYRQLKKQHDSLLNEAIKGASTAQVLQDTGDGFFLSFSSIQQAVRSALIFQGLMAHAKWDHPFQSRVGIHFGEVHESTSRVTGRADFTSAAIDLTSRAMSLAQGGQILLTRTVYEGARHVIREHPPIPGVAAVPTLRWVPHGPYLFKGAGEPIEVFEVGGEGIAPFRAPPASEKACPYIAREAGSSRRKGKPWVWVATAAVVVIGSLGALFLWPTRDPADDAALAVERAELEHRLALLADDPVPILKENPPNTREVNLIEVGDNAAFEVLRDERVYDLRGWKEVPPAKVSELFSAVTVARQLTLKKIGEADRFETQARSSGLTLFTSCASVFPFTVEAQRGETLTGTERMKVRKVSTDVSGVPVGHEFTLKLLTTMWNSAQTHDEQWLGLIGYKKSFLASMLILFPADKPVKSYRLTMTQTGKSDQVDYAGPRVVLLGKNRDWVFWKVPNPQPGIVYRLYWEW